MMARYYLHLHECGLILEDEEGHEWPGLEEARCAAIAAARDIMCGEVRDGRLCLSCNIQIVDEAAGPVDVVTFKDALAISGM